MTFQQCPGVCGYVEAYMCVEHLCRATGATIHVIHLIQHPIVCQMQSCDELTPQCAMCAASGGAHHPMKCAFGPNVAQQTRDFSCQQLHDKEI